jgi:hypothetical protein
METNPDLDMVLVMDLDINMAYILLLRILTYDISQPQVPMLQYTLIAPFLLRAELHTVIVTSSQTMCSQTANIFKKGCRQNYVQQLEIICSCPKFCMRWHRHSTDLSSERAWAKSAEDLRSSPFKKDLSIKTTFSEIQVTGQSIKGIDQGTSWIHLIRKTRGICTFN